MNNIVLFKPDVHTAEKELIIAFLKWQNQPFTVKIKPMENMRVTKGHGQPIVWVGTKEKTVAIVGFISLVNYYQENGYLLA